MAMGSNKRNIKGGKRNRLSYVCKPCRERKTKCDQEKPTCGRCRKLSIECKYDTETQLAPKNPSKDALIARLEKDLKYWKEKTELQLQGNIGRYHELIVECNAEMKAFEDRKQISVIDMPMGNVEIDLFKTHPRLIISKISKREVTPMAMIYIMIQDDYLSTLLTSVLLNVSGNVLIPALTTEMVLPKTSGVMNASIGRLRDIMLKRCKNEYQKKRIEQFADLMVKNSRPHHDPYVAKVLSILYRKVEHEYLEDYCGPDHNYSELLRDLIGEIKECLPPYSIVHQYLDYYFTNLHNLVPFFNPSLFWHTLNEVLIDCDDTIEIKLGNFNLRNKIEGLSILLLVLRLTYMSLKFIVEDIEHMHYKFEAEILQKFPISPKTLIAVCRVLSSENAFSCVNENTITCCLFIWALTVLVPESGNIFHEQPSDIMANTAVILAASIGLHRDPSEFALFYEEQVADKRLRNQRRILWLAVITTTTLEGILKGRISTSIDSLIDSFPGLRDPSSIESFLNLVQKDFVPDTCDKKLDILFFTLYYKRTVIAVLMSELNHIIMTNNMTFALFAFENQVKKCRLFLKDNFKILDENTENDFGSHYEVRLNNSFVISCEVVFHLIMLRLSLALLLYFESLALKNKQFLPYFYKYFTESCKEVEHLAQAFHCYLIFINTGTGEPIYDLTLHKIFQLSTVTLLFALLTLYMRLDLAHILIATFKDEYFYTMEDKNNNQNAQRDERIAVINALKQHYKLIMKSIHSLSSVKLKYKYLSIFKVLTLFEIIIKRLDNNDLWSGLFDSDHNDPNYAHMLRLLEMTYPNILNAESKVIDQLKAKNHISFFTVKDLKILYEEIIQTQSHVKTKWKNPWDKDVMQTQECKMNDSNPTSFFFNFNKDDISCDDGSLSQALNMDLLNSTLDNNETAKLGPTLESDQTLDTMIDSDLFSDYSKLLDDFNFFDYDFVLSNK